MEIIFMLALTVVACLNSFLAAIEGEEGGKAALIGTSVFFIIVFILLCMAAQNAA